MLLLALIACAPARPKTPPLAAAAKVGEVATANGGLFLQGFAVRWVARPHRLRRLGFAAEGTAHGDEPLVGTLRAEARGGSWSDGRLASDRPALSLRYAAIASEDLTSVGGSVHLDVHGTRGREGRTPAEGTTTVTVPLPPALAEAPLAVWLTGFLVDTAPSHPDGYTPAKVSVELGPPTAVQGGVSFDVTVRCDAAPVLDRRQQLAEWGASADVGWLLVAAPGGAVRRVAVRRDIEESLEPNETPGNREPLRVPIRTDLRPDLPPAVAGLSGFSVGMLEDGPVAGRYMRALAIGVEDERQDAARGVFEALVGLQFSNIGPVPRKVRVDASATVTVLQPPRPADVRRGRWLPEPSGFAHVVSYPELQPTDAEPTTDPAPVSALTPSAAPPEAGP